MRDGPHLHAVEAAARDAVPVTDRPGPLATLLEDPMRALAVPFADAAACLAAVSTQMARLEVVRSLLTARLAAGPPPAPSPPSEAGPLTQDEAAARYRLPLRTLRFLTRTKRVASYQGGRNRMVRPADVEGYLARCREQGVRVGTILDV